MSTDPTSPTAAELLAELLSIAVQVEVTSEIAEGILTSPKGQRLVNALTTERLEKIVLKWQWKDWTLITQAVKNREVIAAAQVVTEWLREQTACSCPQKKVAGCDHDD